ncbi:down syndrome cell adhesion molecule-like protein 1 [Caerostris extrusa]|uniref:Down syndrome cell adhesion molecule-like protein 1 n=1 Tax=Caerostris extrusa TaxID=172846 RepID=A0AAV4QLU4_CAEEX|nr:down syndrome cell adhesion molecule-like protein 1 [Caerostris extrusa]
MCFFERALSIAVIILGVTSAIQLSDVPKIKKFSFEENVQEGDLASVICLAVSSSKPLSFSWFKNGEQIGEGTNGVRIDNSGEYSVLILDSVSLQSAGNYTCKVTNPFGSAIHASQLEIKAPPKWLKIPESLVTTTGNVLNVECSASGSPPPRIKWIKHSADSNATEYKTSEGTDVFKGNLSNGILKFPSISYTDAGQYTCIADNNIGPSIKTNFTITIRGRMFKD